jgi:Protein of unknown function (DUF3297)
MVSLKVFCAAGLDRETPLQSSHAWAYQSHNSFKALFMSDELPDRLSTDPKSPFHNAELLERCVGIRFNGVDRTNVEEYCVSEGWVRLAVGKTVDRHGNAMTVKYKGVVEPYLRAPE